MARRSASACPPATSATSSPVGWPSGWGCPIDQFIVGVEPQRHPHPVPRDRDDGDAGGRAHHSAPSMDIQVSSNLERLLFELLDRDGAAVAELMGRFRADGTVSVPADVLARLRAGVRRWTSRRRDRGHGDPADPRGRRPHPRSAHRGGCRGRGSLRGRPCGRRSSASRPRTRPSSPTPSRRAIGVRPPLPAHLADLFDRPERIEHVADDLPARRGARPPGPHRAPLSSPARVELDLGENRRPARRFSPGSGPWIRP